MPCLPLRFLPFRVATVIGTALCHPHFAKDTSQGHTKRLLGSDGSSVRARPGLHTGPQIHLSLAFPEAFILTK